MLVSVVLAVLGQHGRGLFIPDIADALKEQKRQYVRLPVGAIDGTATQDVGCFP
jgi:hypothetical protein